MESYSGLDKMVEGLREAFSEVFKEDQDKHPVPEEKEDGADGESTTYKRVSSLGLEDSVVLTHGAFRVTGLHETPDADVISVTLENGDVFDLLATSMVEVAI